MLVDARQPLVVELPVEAAARALVLQAQTCLNYKTRWFYGTNLRFVLVRVAVDDVNERTDDRAIVQGDRLDQWRQPVVVRFRVRVEKDL